MIDLHAIARAIGLTPRHVVEVGVNEPEKCSVARFIGDGIPATLVEPLPWCAANLRKAFPSARVVEAVCAKEAGEVTLYDRGEGAWIEDVPKGGAPDEHPQHGNMKRDTFFEQYKRRVRAIRFADEIDAKDIDILAVDTEGAEWFVVGQMQKARPRLIRVETHFSHTGYRNPYWSEITDRLASLGYTPAVQDVSDTLFIRRI
jgi:hypothetical protein